MKVHDQDKLNRTQQAAEWLDRLTENGPQAHAAFVDWITASPLHIEAFLNVTTVDTLLNHIDAERRIDVDQLLMQASANVMPLRDAEVSAQRGRKPQGSAPSSYGWAFHRMRWAAGVAGFAALLALAGWWAKPLLTGTQTYATALGEQKTMELTDGSVVSLNTRSQVKLRFSDQTRDVFLEGEAMFKVHHDPARPFRVHSGNAVVQAIGTQFNVNRRPSGTIVTVVEGVVQISTASAVARRSTVFTPPRLAAGEEARVRQDGRIEKRAVTHDMSLASWREQRLVFADDRLDDIAAEFNRWNRAQIHIEGDELAAKLYSGAFDADDPESLVQFLAKDPDLSVQNHDGAVVIRARE